MFTVDLRSRTAASAEVGQTSLQDFEEKENEEQTSNKDEWQLL
jgi:hypothetical protein